LFLSGSARYSRTLCADPPTPVTYPVSQDCLDVVVLLLLGVWAKAAVLAAAMMAASVEARRYRMAQITVVGSKSWIVV